MILPAVLVTPTEQRQSVAASITLSPALRVRDGAWRFLEATMNVDSNPVAAITKHPNNAYTGITTGRITDAGLEHPDAGLIETATRISATVNSGTAMLGISWNTSAGLSTAVGDVVTTHFWVRGSADLIGYTSSLAMMEYGGPAGSRYTTPTPVTFTGAWQRVENTLTIVDADRTSVYAYLSVPRTTETFIDFTAVQTENSPYATPFAMGDMGPGYSWSNPAAPHASSSIRDAGTLRVMLAHDPAEVYLRYRDELGVTTLQMTESGAFGGAGELVIEDGVIDVLTTKEIDVLGMVAYNQPLPEDDRAWLEAQPKWRWTSLTKTYPSVPYTSRIYALSPRVYHANRDNELGREITPLLSDLRLNSDIDRAGPKSLITVGATNPAVIPRGQWIAPFLDITPEQGEITSDQMGLYELGEPDILYLGEGGSNADSSGYDIVSIIQRSTMSQPQVLHKNINMMEEIRRCIEMATMAYTGPNIFPHTYTQPTVDWGTSRSSDSSGWIGTDAVSTNAGNRPRGDHSWSVTFATNCPAEAYRYINALSPGSGRMNVPAGAQRLWVSSYQYMTHPFLTFKFEVRFFDASGFEIPNTRIGSQETQPRATGMWSPNLEVGDVPPDAVTMGFLPMIRTKKQITPADGNVTGYLAGFEVGVALGEPLRRHALPIVRKNPASPIHHRAGTSWLTRINELAQGMGYHALTATMDGRPTVEPIRNVRETAPSRIYSFGTDARIVGDVSTRRASENVANIVTAVKEDVQNKITWTKEARNDDPEHPWSTVNRGPIGIEIIVNEAADEDALQAIADDALARMSAQEDLALGVLPDPTLSIHDIIEVTGTTGPEAGRWAIESITWGLTSDDPLVEIGARRVITSKEAPDAHG